MTGLEVEKEVIIEVGAVITDFDFNEVDQYSAVVKQPNDYIEAMDDWNKTHHKESGLIDLIPDGLAPEKVEENLCDLAHKHFGSEPCVIAGNTIGQDRKFLDKYFKNFSKRLHYRMLDVTAWKIIMKDKYQIEFDKQNKHRAVDDIRESIAELKYYTQHINP